MFVYTETNKDVSCSECLIRAGANEWRSFGLRFKICQELQTSNFLLSSGRTLRRYCNGLYRRGEGKNEIWDSAFSMLMM